MEFVNFYEVRDKIFNDIKRHSLLPIIGSGFSHCCKTSKGGSVPSGTDYKEYMLEKIEESGIFSQTELDKLKNESFSSISEIYNNDEIIPNNIRRNYLIENFSGVILDEKHKIDFLNLNWDYIYTLNIDDAIEKNSRFTQVIYANRDIYDDIFTNEPSVIKLHGDVSDIVKYKDCKCEIFDVKQYAISPETNIKLLQKLRHDLEYQNIIYIGCSLDDEIDLVLSSHFESLTKTNRYFCYVGEINALTRIRLKKYGITHCVRFEDYDCIYKELTNVFVEAEKIQKDELEKYVNYSYKTLSSGYESNYEYLFKGKSPIKNNAVLFPNYFIPRDITKKIVNSLNKYTLVILSGQGCCGKSYVGMELISKIRDRDVYLFESTSGLSYSALTSLINEKERLLIFDEHVLSNSQIELILKHLKIISSNGTKILLISRNNDRDLPGLIRYALNCDYIEDNDINRISVSNKLSAMETKQINSLLVNSSLGVFSDDKSILDNIIYLANQLSIKNKFTKVVPQCLNERQIVCLLILAIQRKIYSKDVVLFNIEEEIIHQCKTCSPLIDQDYTKQYEISCDDNSPIKYVLNAEYWLCDFLSHFIVNHKTEVINSFKYIIKKIITYYGRPDISHSNKDAKYKDYIMFDNIVGIFKDQANLFLIKEIYEALNDDLSSDPNYLHQRAKCYIRISAFIKDINERNEYLNKAFRDSSTAYSVFSKRYAESQNEKVYISASHTLYTKALCKCHLCRINGYIDKSQNTDACNMLYEALQSQYNTYRSPKKDIYNYGDVVKDFVNTIMMNVELIDASAKYKISSMVISINQKNSFY